MKSQMTETVNSQYRKRLPGTALDYFDAREAVEAIQAGAWDKLPYTCLLYTSRCV